MLSINNIRVKRVDPTLSIELVKLVFFDIETTGLRPDKGSKIIEIALLNRNETIFYWKYDVNENSNIPLDDLNILLKCLGSGVMVGHNCFFDLSFIKHETNRQGLSLPNIQFIDTLDLAHRYINIHSYKLKDLLKYFEIEVCGALHTALVDAQAVRALFWKLVEKGGLETAGQAGVKNLNWSNF